MTKYSRRRSTLPFTWGLAFHNKLILQFKRKSQRLTFWCILNLDLCNNPLIFISLISKTPQKWSLLLQYISNSKLRYITSWHNFFLMIFVSIKIMIQNNLLITIYTGTCTCINTCIISINDLERDYFLKQPVYFV